jgi:mono/diheme cytochrome c family protein
MTVSLRTLFSFVVIAVVTFSSISCSKKEEDKVADSSSAAPDAGQAGLDQMFDVERIARGARLFQEKCAQCHGPEAQGHPDWERGRREGFAAAPPLNGTGTDITLSKTRMMEIIRKGVSRNGVPVMPTWEGRVSDQDVEDVITWYQALWPGEIYQKWQRAFASDPGQKKTGNAKG